MANRPFTPATDGELYDALTPDPELSERVDERSTNQSRIALGLAILVLLVGGLATVQARRDSGTVTLGVTHSFSEMVDEGWQPGIALG